MLTGKTKQERVRFLAYGQIYRTYSQAAAPVIGTVARSVKGAATKQSKFGAATMDPAKHKKLGKRKKGKNAIQNAY